MSTPGQLLLVICAFLCLIPGADALICSECVAEKGDQCKMTKCEIDGGEGTCIGLIAQKGEEVHDKVLACMPKSDVKCDATAEDPSNGIHYELKCCDQSDLCNSEF